MTEINLVEGEQDPPLHNLPQNKPLISLFTAICLVIANMIGTGVFTSLGFQVIGIKSGFALLFLWLLGGIFAICGALCYGELGAAMPRSGGEYHYLSKLYHPLLGFLSGWLSITVGFTTPIAAAAMALGAYLSSVFPIIPRQEVAILIVIIISLIQTNKLPIVSYFQQFFTILKLLLISILIICGFSLATPQDISFIPSLSSWAEIFSSPFAISLVFVTYSYSGWNATIYLASEVKEPQKNVPISLLIGTIIVMLLYLLLNFIFLYSTPIDQLVGKLQIGSIAAGYIFGNAGSKIMGLLISMGLIASISSMILAGPRVTQVIGEDIYGFRILARKNKHGVPYYALLLQLCLSIILIITSSFETVINYMSFTLTLSSFMTVCGVFISRMRYSYSPNIYRTWGYPITPIIFLGISLWLLIFLLKEKPVESLAGLATIVAGIPIYFLASRNQLTKKGSVNED